MPTQRENLLALRERVLAAKGADRQLDAEIAITLELCPTGSMRMSALRDEAAFATGPHTSWKAPHWSGSVDAALALVEQALPGWCPELTRKRSADPEHWGCKISEQWASYAAQKFGGHGPTAPLAILVALLSALASHEAANVE